MTLFLDQLFEQIFEAAHTAIFEVGSIMAVLMLVIGILDYRYGDKLRSLIESRKLDQPVLMTLLSLIPVDGTLLFQYNLYRRKSIRFGSLTAGILGIGEESTYLIFSRNPLTWLLIAAIKLVTGAVTGGIINAFKGSPKRTDALHAADEAANQNEDVVNADKNFHELPDKFRHKLHHFRYHRLGKAFWFFFAVSLVLFLITQWIDRDFPTTAVRLSALGIPLIHWLSAFGLFIIVIYRIMIRMTTREFGKIFEHEFEDQGDSIGDLAETCSSVIILIFVMTFIVNLAVNLIGLEIISAALEGRDLMAILIGALIGLVPGTGASLAFTALYFNLAGTAGALPFASLLACSMALIGDTQIIGRQVIRHSQRAAHLIAFFSSLAVSLAVFGITRWLF